MAERSFTDPMPVAELTVSDEVDVLAQRVDTSFWLAIVGAYIAGVITVLTPIGLIVLFGG